MSESGYRDCACRDCFEIAIGEEGVLCSECVKAGCDNTPRWPNVECQAPHAYGGHCGDSACCDEDEDEDRDDPDDGPPDSCDPSDSDGF